MLSGFMLAGAGTWLLLRDGGNQATVSCKATKGEFEVSVLVSGELEARNSLKILGPQELEGLGIYQVKIADLIPEGSVVRKGDYIGELDKTELASRIREAFSEVQKFETQLEQTQLDTALQLRQTRDELINLDFSIKEKELTLEQSTYEPPATIKQIQLDLERTKRSMEQAKKNYLLRKHQMVARMQEVIVSLEKVRERYNNLLHLEEQFRITAPEDGMLIYYKDWDGGKRIVGSQVQAWNPVVATLPDLSSMISRTYVNEVDIRKVSVGQKVLISLDAFPDKKFSGKVSSVANVGEQSPRSDAKVFEVLIALDQRDRILLPAMTTANKIIISILKDVVSVPQECVFADKSGISFVYVRKGTRITKQEVKPGIANENFIVIEKGLAGGDEVLLNPPESNVDIEIVSLK